MSKFNITNLPLVTLKPISENDSIIFVEYQTRYELCSNFMRIQEFYESDIECIKGKYFTLESYMDEYAKKNGGFSYTMDWSGFNIPSSAYYGFMELFGDKLLEKEKILFDYINTLLMNNSSLYNYTENKRFYIIGSYKECPRQASVIQHEIAHALYTLDDMYRYHSDLLCDTIPFRSDIIDVLKDWGYGESVIKDELQAYVTTNSKADWKSFPTVDTKNTEFRKVIDARKIFFKQTCDKYDIFVPKSPTENDRKAAEKAYKAKYGYNAGA